MRFYAKWLVSAAFLGLTAIAVSQPPDAPAKKAVESPARQVPGDSSDPVLTPDGFVRFRIQEIDKSLNVGYAVLAVDVNGDGKLDIVVVDTNKVYWYENPTWKRRVIIGPGKTKADNVCIAAMDIDGDGKLDFALGADWGALGRTKEGGTIQWLKQGETIDDPWMVHPIGEEPTVHRMRFVDLDGDGKPSLVVMPLMGRDSTQKGLWVDGRPVRILAYKIPADPVKGPWVPKVLDQSLYVVHNFEPFPSKTRERAFDLLTASYEGVNLIAPEEKGSWKATRIGEGDQSTPQSNRGSSEVKWGKAKDNARFIATIEPWHGNRIVTYTPNEEAGKLWNRHTVDSRLRWGHAVACADLDGDGVDELIIGVRNNPLATDAFKDRCGVRVYRCSDSIGAKWEDRLLLDPDGVAVEDLVVADLDRDGRPDIIAVGRFTGNMRIYWNVGR